VRLALVRLTAAVFAASALAAAGCGGGHTLATRGPAAPASPSTSAQAPNAERMSDLVPLTTAQAARAADRIALVVALGSRVVEGAPGTPFTRTRFAVRRTLKGRLPRRFVTQVIGGRLGGTVVDSPAPAFARSHRYILFLGPDGPAGPTLFPQAVVHGRRVHDVLAALRRWSQS
jgi:hypothetical protein